VAGSRWYRVISASAFLRDVREGLEIDWGRGSGCFLWRGPGVRQWLEHKIGGQGDGQKGCNSGSRCGILGCAPEMDYIHL